MIVKCHPVLHVKDILDISKLHLCWWSWVSGWESQIPKVGLPLVRCKKCCQGWRCWNSGLGRCVKDFPPKLGQVLVQPLRIQLIQKTFEEAFHFETLHWCFFQIHAFALLGTVLVADFQLDMLKFNRWRSSSGHCEATSLASYLMDVVGFCG